MAYNDYSQQGWPYGAAPQQPQFDGQMPPQQQPSSYPAYPPYPQQGAQGGTPPVQATSPGGIPGPAGFVEQSYIENILRMNLEKVATVYMTFEHEGASDTKVFRGEVEAAGRDHVIINDNKTGTRYLLPLIYLDYVTFQGPINYSYPYE